MRLSGMLFGVLLFMVALPAQAALLYFDPGESTLNPGDTLVMSVRLNTGPDECINVIDGVITYDPVVQPVDISIGQSILPLWVEAPTINREENKITFAGGIPNGYCGRVIGDPRLTNEVLKIVFQVPGLRIGYGNDNPTSTISFAPETKVLLNDGRGTPAELTTTTAVLGTTRTPGASLRNEWSVLVNADDDAPEKFSVGLIQDDLVFGGKYYVIFNTTDKQTGIAYYEIIEEPLSEAKLFNWGSLSAPWLKAKSPYVLKDQTLNSTIRVRAVDKSGNEYVATLIPEDSKRATPVETIILFTVLAVSGLLLLVFFWVLYHFWRRQVLRKREREDGEEEACDDSESEGEEGLEEDEEYEK